jgi:hypothetical protein
MFVFGAVGTASPPAVTPTATIDTVPPVGIGAAGLKLGKVYVHVRVVGLCASTPVALPMRVSVPPLFQ